MALHVTVNSRAYQYRVEPGTREVVKGFRKYKNLNRLWAMDAIDYQMAVFGGMRFRTDKNGKEYLFCGRAHFERLKQHAVNVGIIRSKDEFPMTYEEFEKIVLSCRKTNLRYGDSNYVRPRMFSLKDEHGVASSGGWQFEVCTSNLGVYYDNGMNLFMDLKEDFPKRPLRGYDIMHAKGANCIYPMGRKLAQFAQSYSCSDVVMLDDRKNTIVDALTANLLLFKDDKVFTPKLEGNALCGITRQYYEFVNEEAGVQVIEKPITISELKDSDSLQLIGTAVGTTRAKMILLPSGEKIEFRKSDLATECEERFYQAIAERKTYPIERFRMF